MITKTTIYKLLPLLLVLSTMLFTSCGKDTTGPDSSDVDLTITGFSPTTARVNEEITITGTGFSSEPTENQVFFRSHLDYEDLSDVYPAEYVSHTTTSIIVKVPDAGAVQNGPITVRVNGQLVQSEADFILDSSLGAPVLENLSPGSGIPGSEVTITGDNFGNDTTALSVMFDDVEAQVVSVGGSNRRGSEIVVTVPDGLPEGEVQVSVTRNGVQGGNTLLFTVDPIPAQVRAIYMIDGGIIRAEVTETSLQFTTLYDEATEPLADNITLLKADFVNGVLYWINSGGDIIQAPTDGGASPQQVYSIGNFNIYDLDIDTENNVLYLTHDNDTGSGINVSKYNIDSGTLTPLYTFSWSDDPVFPEKIAVDAANNKLYISMLPLSYPSGAGYIVVGDLNGGTASMLVSGEDLDGNGYAITAVDVIPTTGELFFINFDNGTTAKIYNTTETGSASLLLESDGNILRLPTDIQADVETGYVYFMDTQGVMDHTIRRTQLDGSNMEVLYEHLTGSSFELEIE